MLSFFHPLSHPMTSHIFSFIYVEEVVKSLSEIYFDVTKMDCNSPVSSNLLKDASEKPGVDPTQVQEIDQPTEFNQLNGLELVQYIDHLNFLAEASKSQIEQETRNGSDSIPSSFSINSKSC